MAAIITEKFRLQNAGQFEESFSESNEHYYMFLGKSSPFTSGTSGGSDTSPPTPVDDITSENYRYDSMLGLNKIASTDVARVINRRTFVSGTTYDMYEHNISTSNVANNSSATSLFDSTFYFITSEHKVYKVLYNLNSSTGNTQALSSEPTFTSPVKQFVGGYYLQYMYTLSTSEISKFLTTDFMPATTDSTVSSAAASASGDTAPFNGAPIDVFLVTSQGSGYPNGTYYAKVQGDGTGGILKIVVSGNAITYFGESGVSTVQAAGSGYTFATVSLASTNIYTDTGATSLISGSTQTTWNSASAGAITPIISPVVGHGRDAQTELGSHFVMMNTKFEQEEGSDITVQNDFRQVGIVKNPTQFGSTSLFTATTGRQTKAVLLASNSGNFDTDEKITQATTGAVGKVVEWDATNKILYYCQERFSNHGVDSSGNLIAFSGTNTINGADSSASGTPSSSSSTVDSAVFVSGYSTPEVQPDSGDIIYIENRRPISRASDQTEDIKIIVEF
tara:strand:- start:8438 stop:9955 length:1518 start_codon:yes stop_codon:yes gene_type:complete